MPASEIFSIILMGAAALLCLALVFYLYRITNSITTIQENLSGLSSELHPIINNITELTNKINDVTEELKQPVYEAVDVVDEIKERVDVLFGLEEKIRNSLGVNLTGIYNGVKTFFEIYKTNGNGTHRRTRRHQENSSEKIFSRQF
jgi:uncharacterized protein YoxC